MLYTKISLSYHIVLNWDYTSYVRISYLLQIEAIKGKYSKLEEELMELRAKQKTEINQFVDDRINETWSHLKQHRLRNEARLTNSHQVS